MIRQSNDPRSSLVYSQNPSTKTEYILDLDNGYIYRYSNHWGEDLKHNNLWTIDNLNDIQLGRHNKLLGRIKLTDFKIRPGSKAYAVTGRNLYESLSPLEKVRYHYRAPYMASENDAYQFSDFMTERVPGLKPYKKFIDPSTWIEKAIQFIYRNRKGLEVEKYANKYPESLEVIPDESLVFRPNP